MSRITLYEKPGGAGREVTLTKSTPDLRVHDFDDITSSIKVQSGTWILYESINYGGRSFTVTPGLYTTDALKEEIGDNQISSVKLVVNCITLYERNHCNGREVMLTDSTPDLRSVRDFNGIASSFRVQSGVWTVFQNVGYGGKSHTFSPGLYNNDVLKQRIGNDLISSVKVESCITLHELADFGGRELSLTASIPDLRTVSGFSAIASSIKVLSGIWTVYQDVGYSGRSHTVGPGSYNMAELKEKIGDELISSIKLHMNNITLYEDGNFMGREVTLTESAPDLCHLAHFNGIASSISVHSGTWTVYQSPAYCGRYSTLTPGTYNMDVLRSRMGNGLVSSLRLESHITLYELANFKGREISATQSIPDLRCVRDFNDVASSFKVQSGTWTVYQHVDYSGTSYTVGPGTYNMAVLKNIISSAKKIA